jgi:methionine-rich copper-binding protein CopC
MVTRLFASAILLAGLSQTVLAQGSVNQNQPSNAAENTQAPENLPIELRQKLTSAGFSDVKVVPSSFVVSAKDQHGRPILMHLTPHSMTVMTEVPVSNTSTSGAGGASPANSDQSK